MPRPLYALLALLALLPLAGPAAAADDPKALAAEARAVMKAACGRCHDGAGSSTPYKFDVGDPKTLVAAVGGRKKPVVVPGKPDESPLWRAIADERMPQAESPEAEKFPAAKLEAVKRWIAAGAPAFPRPGEQRPPVSAGDTLRAVRADLRAAPKAKRADLRYFTLAHTHNDPDASDADLRTHRAALSKALNSVSPAGHVTAPRVVDPAGTVLAIDAADYGLDDPRKWQALADAYPYGLRFKAHPDAQLRLLDEEIVDLTGCDLPVLRADWFVATATRPPLYHALAGVPHTSQELERRLGVRVADNFVKDRLARAGFHKSGVSGQNRLVERHDTASGPYWKSYDFLPDAGRGRLVRFPLGPLDLFAAGRHPFEAQAFAHDGGELIYPLANGLQAYMLVKATGERIDEGPISIVGDNNRISGTPAIVNGVSCMACHTHGVIRFADQVRENAAVFGAPEEKVRRLYPDAAAMGRLLDRDEERFLAALDRAVRPFLMAGPDAGRALKDFPEPVAAVARDHRLRYLDLDAIAREVFLKDKAELLAKVGEKKLKQLGLDPVLKGDKLPRLQWESGVGVTLMQEVARELRYTPFGGPAK